VKEKNRETLLRALGQLPRHTPPDQVWEAVQFQLDERDAEQPLRQAIRNLPDHEPPASLWENIQEAVNEENTELPLQRAIAELPSYDPPSFVWEAIEAELGESSKQVAIESSIKVIPLWRRPAVAAGLTALICAMAWLFFAPNDGEKVSMAYSTIEINTDFDDKEELRDEEAFELVMNEFNHQLAMLNDPYLEELKKELDDLDLAKRQLEKVIGAYGDDEELIQQITRIEHDRSAVLKEMVNKI